MTYLEFHLVFILPALLALSVGLAVRRPSLGPRARWSLPALALLAFVWTAPWDNYLVARGIWAYGEDRVIGTVGWVPYEEYAFFVVQPVLTGLWFYLVLDRWPLDLSRARGSGRRAVVVWLVLSAVGCMMLANESTTYLGLILAWACPVLAGQMAFAGPVIRAGLRPVLVGVVVPTLYLWIADRSAIQLGIWSIAERFTTGLRISGLPIEEAVFFLLTNILVVQGLVLLLYPARARTVPA